MRRTTGSALPSTGARARKQGSGCGGTAFLLAVVTMLMVDGRVVLVHAVSNANCTTNKQRRLRCIYLSSSFSSFFRSSVVAVGVVVVVVVVVVRSLSLYAFDRTDAVRGFALNDDWLSKA